MKQTWQERIAPLASVQLKAPAPRKPRNKAGLKGLWREMRQRCLNPKHGRYRDYGGRGITVCERWLNFENFKADMGERPKDRCLDRINNDGDYSPDNCRWATYEESEANKRDAWELQMDRRVRR